MPLTRDDLRRFLLNTNVRAILRVVKAAESDQTERAYTRLFGTEHFTDLSAHPRIAKGSKWGWTSAAGAYQIMAAVPGKVKTDTEGWLLKRYGFTDFSAEQQDERAVALIIRRGALDEVLNGRFEEAIELLNEEWAGLPGSPYGQPTISMEKARQVYAAWGGRFGPAQDAGGPESRPVEAPADGANRVMAPAPQRPAGGPPLQPERAPAAARTTKKEQTTMAGPLIPVLGALAQAVFPILASRVPWLQGAENQAVINAVGPMLVEAAQTAAQTESPAAAAEAVVTQPEVEGRFLAETAKRWESVAGVVDEILRAEDASRDRAAQRAKNDPAMGNLGPAMFDRMFLLSVAIMASTGLLLGIQAWRDKALNEGLIAFFVGSATMVFQKIGTMVDYRFGGSIGSRTKDDIIERELERRSPAA